MNNAKKLRKIIGWERLRDLFKKTRNTNGTFQAKLGTIKDRNDSMDLTKAEDIKTQWQEYTELYKKVLMTWITTIVFTHLEPDILVCEVK